MFRPARARVPTAPPIVAPDRDTSIVCGSDASARRYATKFLGAENPLSEGGAWSNLGQSWTTVMKADGFASGTQTGARRYDDSYAHLSGFSPNVSASATLFKAPGIPANEYHEVELLLRFADSVDNATGYECLLHHAGRYAQIVRWNGPFGNFTHLADQRHPPVPQDGDVLKATIVGNLITVYLNDAKIVQIADSTYRVGNPGIGFYIEGNTRNRVFGFKDFSAVSL